MENLINMLNKAKALGNKVEAQRKQFNKAEGKLLKMLQKNGVSKEEIKRLKQEAKAGNTEYLEEIRRKYANKSGHIKQ